VSEPKSEKVAGITSIKRLRHDPIVIRIKTQQIAEVPTSLAIGAIITGGVGIIEEFGFPFRRGVADGIHLRDDIVPIRLDIRRLRKDTGHSNNRHILMAHSAIRPNCVLLPT
jgi:hypothetical protein